MNTPEQRALARARELAQQALRRREADTEHSGDYWAGALANALGQLIDATAGTTIVERWWITTDALARGGEKLIGPFESQQLAMKVRRYFERVNAPNTYWVDKEDETAAEGDAS